MKKKLLMTASTLPRWAGDTEPRFVLDLAKALLPYFDVTVLAPMAPGAAKAETLEGVKILRYSYFPIEKLQTLCYPGAIVPRIKQKKARALLVPFMVLSLWAKLLRIHKQYDVIHAHWLIPQGIVQSCFNTPYIVTGHGGDVTALNKGLLKSLKRLCLTRACAVTAVSTHLRDEMRKLSPETAVSILSMGCDTSEFSPSNRRPDYFNQGERRVVLFVGRLAEKKGVTYLIEAMKQVDAMLVIAGDGPLRQTLERQAQGLGERVVFLGPKTHDELAALYASADVFAAPSVRAKDGDVEGFGLVFLEAMASGLPVVASNSGGIPDLVKDGENGLLAAPADANDLADKLRTVLTDAALRDKLRRGGLQTARQYDYAEVGARYARVIAAAAEKKRLR